MFNFRGAALNSRTMLWLLALLVVAVAGGVVMTVCCGARRERDVRGYRAWVNPTASTPLLRAQ